MAHPMEPPKKTLVQRFGAEAVIMAVIAGAAAFAAAVSFQEHTESFERVAQRDISRIDSRVSAIEGRERLESQILTRVDTHVEELRTDVASLRAQVSIILTRLPVKSK